MGKEIKIRIDADEVQLILDLPNFELIPPTTGIYDEPVRWYKANIFWAKIIEGFVGNLLNYHAWKEAENENFVGVQEIATWLEGVETPLPEFPPEGDCFNYMPSASFVLWYPQDPYNQPNYVPPDYLVPPFFVNSAFEYPELFGYKATDVFLNPAAINIDPIDIATLNFPQFQVTVKGSGQIEVDLLAVQAGGVLVYKVGSPPNLIDIIQDGTIGSDVTIVDLNVDSIGIPPETDVVVSEEINIEAEPGESTTVYFVFVPLLDDSLIPLRFGGGLRQIGLCAFEQAGGSMLEDVRFNVATCTFEKRVDGVWQPQVGGADWLDCVPPGGGGGGGAANFKNDIRIISLSGNQTTGSTTFVDFTGNSFNYTPTYPNIMVLWDGVVLQNSGAANITEARILFDNTTGIEGDNWFVRGTTARALAIAQRWENLSVGVERQIKLQWRISAGTGTFIPNNALRVVIFEYENIEQLFVQDIRITAGRELQKQIGGVWFTVTDSLNSFFQSIDNQIASIIAVNNSQQTTINTHTNQITSIQNVNTTQNNNIANHESRLDSIEDVDLPQINLTLGNHETRITALENAPDGDNTWGGYPLGSITHLVATPGLGYYSPFSSFDSSGDDSGWVPTGNADVDLFSTNANRLGAVRFVRVAVTTLVGFAGDIEVRVNGSTPALAIASVGSSTNISAYLAVPPSTSPDMHIEANNLSGNQNWRLKHITYLAVNYNPFTLEVLP